MIYKSRLNTFFLKSVYFFKWAGRLFREWKLVSKNCFLPLYWRVLRIFTYWIKVCYKSIRKDYWSEVNKFLERYSINFLVQLDGFGPSARRCVHDSRGYGIWRTDHGRSCINIVKSTVMNASFRVRWSGGVKDFGWQRVVTCSVSVATMKSEAEKQVCAQSQRPAVTSATVDLWRTGVGDRIDGW